MRRLLVLVSAVVFVDAMLFGALIPLVPAYADEFDLSKAGAGLLLGAFGAGALAGGLPGGLLAARFGPRRAVLGGLVLLAAASFAFALSGSPWTLGLSRFVQGFSSTTTWAGALAWLTVATPRERRGQTIGTAFGFAVFGAILGPLFGSLAHAVGIRAAFAVTGGVALGLAAWSALSADAPAERGAPGALGLNPLPAMLFGVLGILAPLRLDAEGLGTAAIGAAFFAAGLLETGLNPLVGRFSDRHGRLLPTQIALGASMVVAIALADAWGDAVPYLLAAGLCLATLVASTRVRPLRRVAAARGTAAAPSPHRAGGGGSPRR